MRHAGYSPDSTQERSLESCELLQEVYQIYEGRAVDRYWISFSAPDPRQCNRGFFFATRSDQRMNSHLR